MHFPFHEIEYFLMVAECLNYSAAASRLYISQPSLSKVISGMEESLGFKLFKRSTRKVELTEKGLCFYALSKSYFDQCETLIHGSSTPDTVTGRLSIIFENIVDSTYMPFIIAAFRQKYPGILISTAIRKTEAILADLRSGKSDVGVVSSFVIPPQGFHSRLLYPYRLQLFVWKGHPLWQRKSVRLEELTEENFIILNPSTSRSSETILRLLAAAGFPVTSSQYAENNRQFFLFISQKEGVAFNLTMSEAAAYWDLCSIPVDLTGLPKLTRTVGVALAWSEAMDNPAAQYFLQTMETLTASMPEPAVFTNED